MTVTTEKEFASCNLTILGNLKTYFFWDIGRIYYAAGMAVTKEYYPEIITPPDNGDLRFLYDINGISARHKKMLKKHFKHPDLNKSQIEKLSIQLLREDLQEYFQRNLADSKTRIKIEALSGALLMKNKLTAPEIEYVLSKYMQS